MKKTQFGKPEILTVSEITGGIEKAGRLNRRGVWFTKRLNKFFKQQAHAPDAYDYNKGVRELKRKYFN